jgi:hypothetical protein
MVATTAKLSDKDSQRICYQMRHQCWSKITVFGNSERPLVADLDIISLNKNCLIENSLRICYQIKLVQKLFRSVSKNSCC